MASGTINISAYEVLLATSKLRVLQKRASMGAQRAQSIRMSASTGASADAISKAASSVSNAYLETQELIERAIQYLNNAKGQFSAVDVAIAGLLFALTEYGQTGLGEGGNNG